MFREDTAKNWEKFGRWNPYYGVNTAKIYRGSELDAARKQAFFAQGQAHIDALMQGPVSAYSTETFKVAVDFGVGVGRLAIPLRRYAEEVWGVDIAQSMLNRAARHAEEAGVRLNLCRALADLPQNVDFVHSFIVLQHIPVPAGEAIVAGLYDRLRPGGIGALHVPIQNARALLWRYVAQAQKIAPLRYLINLLRGAPFNDPVMQMNVYNLNRIVDLLFQRGALNLQLIRVPTAWTGVYLLFVKGDSPAAGNWWTDEAVGKFSSAAAGRGSPATRV